MGSMWLWFTGGAQKVTKIDKNSQKLTKIDKNWQKLTKIHTLFDPISRVLGPENPIFDPFPGGRESEAEIASETPSKGSKSGVFGVKNPILGPFQGQENGDFEGDPSKSPFMTPQIAIFPQNHHFPSKSPFALKITIFPQNHHFPSKSPFSPSRSALRADSGGISFTSSLAA